MLKKVIVGASLVAASAWAGVSAARSAWQRWGIDPAEAIKVLPGDDLVAEPQAIDTRGIDISAPPADVWPWLLQMGYGRAGWYSYDQLDMNHPSVDRIVPELQQLAVGDVVPTHPNGGFVVKVLEPQVALVVYLDRAVMTEQQAAAGSGLADASANVRATGAYLGTAVPGEFSASWAFALEPTPTGGTRLIERFRVHMDDPSGSPAAARFGRSMLGFGVFVMVRRQMLGIRDRAEGRPISVPFFGMRWQPKTATTAHPA